MDFDNFAGSCNGRGIKIDPAVLKEKARAAGKIVWAAVFVDSSTLTPQERSSWFASGFDICDCPKMQGKEDRARKDSVDPKIIQKLNAVADLLPVDGVLLASADRDYTCVVEHLRDVGKRVYIVAASEDEVTSLAGHADGVIIYENGKTQTNPFLSVAGFFGGKGRPNDRDTAILLDRLSGVILYLDKRLNINRKRFGFLRIVQALQASVEAGDAGITAEEMRRFLQFLIAQDVITQNRAPKGGKSSFTYYEVNRQHPFVKSVRESDDSGAAVALAVAVSNATPTHHAIAAGSPRGEEHPRVKRYRERLRKRDEIWDRRAETFRAQDVRASPPPEDPEPESHDLQTQLRPILAGSGGNDGEDRHR